VITNFSKYIFPLWDTIVFTTVEYVLAKVCDYKL